MDIYILQTREGAVCGVYSDKDELRKGVDHWIKEWPGMTYIWQLWDMNTHQDKGWEFAYISPTYEDEFEDIPLSMVPEDDWHGINLIGVEWY